MKKSDKVARFSAEHSIKDAIDFNIIEYVHIPGKSFWHEHDYFELVYVLSGSGFHKTLQKKSRIKKGSLLFINKGEPHTYQNESAIRLVNLLFLQRYIKGLSSEPALRSLFAQTYLLRFSQGESGGCRVLTLAADKVLALEKIIRKQILVFAEREKNWHSLLHLGWLELFMYLDRFLDSNERKIVVKNDSVNPEIENTIVFVRQHFHEKLSLDGLASRTPYNAAYFSHLFKMQTGFSLVEYINECRISKACELLTGSRANIADIAQSVGFDSLSFFNLLFKKQLGMSPRALRNSVKKQKSDVIF